MFFNLIYIYIIIYFIGDINIDFIFFGLGDGIAWVLVWWSWGLACAKPGNGVDSLAEFAC
jgi:hypothetical protein